MTFSVYDISLPVFINSLQKFDLLLDKARSFAEGKKINPSTLLQTRLIPDQFPLSKQIQIACDTAKLFVPRLTDIQAPKNDDSEVSFEDFQARIRSTVAFLQTVKPEAFKGWEAKEITFPWNPGKSIDAPQYVLHYAIPNFFFHITTAYSILRSSGMDMGKSDYLNVNWK